MNSFHGPPVHSQGSARQELPLALFVAGQGRISGWNQAAGFDPNLLLGLAMMSDPGNPDSSRVEINFFIRFYKVRFEMSVTRWCKCNSDTKDMQ